MGLPQRVQVGTDFENFPAGSFNALVDDYYARKAEKRNQIPPQRSFIPQFLAVSMKNTSGADALPGYVLGLDDLVFNIDDDPALFHQMPVMLGVEPTTADHADRFCILRNHLANNETRPLVGTIMGIAAVLLEVTTEAHTHAKVKDGDATCLASSTSGPARIIWKQTGTGSPAKKAIVLLGAGGGGGEVNFRFGAASTVIDPATGWDIESAGGGSAIYVGEDGEQDGAEMTVINRYFNTIPQWSPLWILDDGSVIPIPVNVGCTPGTPITIA